MVWALFHVDPVSGKDKYYIFARGTYKVGRKGCDVFINKDKGVSRIHAEIVVDKLNSLNPLNKRPFNTLSKVRIRDCSKYGTFINENLGQKEKVHELPNKETTLEDGDLVSFGTGNATYRVLPSESTPSRQNFSNWLVRGAFFSYQEICTCFYLGNIAYYIFINNT